MVPHPSKQTKTERIDTWKMIDAFRMVEHDLHYRLMEMQTIPNEWDGIYKRLQETHPRRTRMTAEFDADVVRYFKGLGRGYQRRMNLVLRAYMHGRLAKIIEGPDTTDYILHPERIAEHPEPWGWGKASRTFARWQAEAAERDAERGEGE